MLICGDILAQRPFEEEVTELSKFVTTCLLFVTIPLLYLFSLYFSSHTSPGGVEI